MEGKIVKSGSRNDGDQRKRLTLDIHYTINGWGDSSQGLGNTDRNNLSRKLLLGQYYSPVDVVENVEVKLIFLTSIIKDESRIMVYFYIHKRIYQVLEQIKNIHLIINFWVYILVTGRLQYHRTN